MDGLFDAVRVMSSNMCNDLPYTHLIYSNISQLLTTNNDGDFNHE